MRRWSEKMTIDDSIEQADIIDSSHPPARGATAEEAASFLNSSRSIKPRNADIESKKAAQGRSRATPATPKSKGKLPKVKRSSVRPTLSAHTKSKRSGDIYDVEDAPQKPPSPSRGAEGSPHKKEVAHRPKADNGPSIQNEEMIPTSGDPKSLQEKDSHRIAVVTREHEGEGHRGRGRPRKNKTVPHKRSTALEQQNAADEKPGGAYNASKDDEVKSPSKKRKISGRATRPEDAQQDNAGDRARDSNFHAEHILQPEEEHDDVDRFHGYKRALWKSFALVDRIGVQTSNGVETAHKFEFRTKLGRVLERQCRKNTALWKKLLDADEEEAAGLWESADTEISELKIALEASFNNEAIMSKRRAFGQDIYAKIFPAMMDLLQAVCTYSESAAKSIGLDEKIPIERVATTAELIVMLMQLIGTAKREGFLPDTNIPLIKPVGQILAQLREVAMSYNRLEARHNHEMSQRKRSAMLHAQRREKDAQQKDEEKVNMRNNLLLRLRTARLEVEPDFRLHETLRSRPITPADELDVDANGEAFERIGIFGRRSWSTNPRLHGGKWSDSQQQALLDGLEEFWG